MPDRASAFQFIADRGDSQLRLDQVLQRRVTAVTHMSRSVAQRWIEAGAVTVDGRVAKRSSDRVRLDSTIHIAFPPDTVFRSVPEPEPGDLDILYEDEAIIAVNKPPGVVVHPSYKQPSGTLLNRILWHARERSGFSPGILTRLDKDTSGIVIVALTGAVHAAMQRDAAAGRVRKEYLAVVHGSPSPLTGVIRDPLGRDPDDRRRVIVAADGAASETRYHVTRACQGDLSLVCCELITGRTHQIRVHLSARGWPVAGDRLYGGRTDQIDRQALHAWRVSLPHPITRELLAVEAPVPQDFKRISC